MKLTPAQIAKIESVLTMHEEGFGARAVIIEFGISDLVSLSYFYRVLRNLGLDIPKLPKGMPKGSLMIPSAEHAAFLDWLKERKRQSQASSNGAAR